MTRLQVVRDPDGEACDRVSALDAANPFYTREYTESRRRLGLEPFLLFERVDDESVSGCAAFLRAGRVTSSLEIPSVPSLADPEAFWKDLGGYCREGGIHYLVVNSYASRAARIPEGLEGLRAREPRYEYVLDLEGTDLPGLLSSNHRRNVEKAGKTGLNLRRRASGEAVSQHVRLIEESMQRRRSRGEDVPADIPREPFEVLIGTGSAQFFQACEDEEALSSVLLLMAPEGAYYQSAGTGPRGRSCGASHFALHRAALTLQEEGLKTFNLGGVDDPDSGLARFKSSFGGDRIDLASATFYFGSAVHNVMEGLSRAVRNASIPFLG